MLIDGDEGDDGDDNDNRERGMTNEWQTSNTATDGPGLRLWRASRCHWRPLPASPNGPILGWYFPLWEADAMLRQKASKQASKKAKQAGPPTGR